MDITLTRDKKCGPPFVRMALVMVAARSDDGRLCEGGKFEDDEFWDS